MTRRRAEVATRGVLIKKVFLEISQNSQENTCSRVRNFTQFTGKHLFQSLFFNKVAGLSKNTFFTEHLWKTASRRVVRVLKFLLNLELTDTHKENSIQYKNLLK